MHGINQKQIEEAVKAAQEATSNAEPALRNKAFEVVLAHLLGQQGKPATKSHEQAPIKVTASDVGTSVAFNEQRIASNLNITVEKVRDLYELRGDILHLSVKPTGKTVSDCQRKLTHALLVGYRLGLDEKSVPITKLTVAADEWNVMDKNFGRNINDEYVQMKGGGGRGMRPEFSLAPGAVDKLREEVVSTLG